MKKAVIVSCFDTYNERTYLIKEYYQSLGYDTKVICSNFQHIKKEYISSPKKDTIYIKTRPYYKNISIKRLYSHYTFAFDFYELISDMSIDILYVLVPANSLAKFAARYKYAHPNTILYFDIIDLWPETMPVVNKFKKIPLYIMWRNLRDKYLDAADYVFSECNLFLKVMDKLNNSKFQTLLWAKNDTLVKSFPSLDTTCVNLCYLGSINNIIDINLISALVQKISHYKPCKVHIIGAGEKKKEFMQSIEAYCLNIIDHGILYDRDEKQRVFDQCDFGLNIMKDSVCIGLTMKSLDYFMGQLPIINTIPEDTSILLEKYQMGFNIDKSKIDEIAKKICHLDKEENLKMRLQTRKAYEENFTKDIFFKKLSIEDKD